MGSQGLVLLSGWQGLQMALELPLAVINVHLLLPPVPFSALPPGLGCHIPLFLTPSGETCRSSPLTWANTASCAHPCPLALLTPKVDRLMSQCPRSLHRPLLGSLFPLSSLRQVREDPAPPVLERERGCLAAPSARGSLGLGWGTAHIYNEECSF